VHTTDANWQKMLISQSVTEIFKVAQLELLAVYMNCDCKLFQEFNQNNYQLMFKESIASKTMKPSDYDFILGPITSEARLKMNPDPELNNFSIPKIILNLMMESRLDLKRHNAAYRAVWSHVTSFSI
jgi:vacuolar protein sorting-associated protein 13A/C